MSYALLERVQISPQLPSVEGVKLQGGAYILKI